jgi:TolA-binding protein
MAELVEARRDGRLRERELASLERHLSTCASCRAADQQLTRIASYVREPLPGDVSPLEHQRGRLALLRAAVRPATRARRWHVAAAPAAAVLLAMAALTAAVRSPGRVPLATHMPPPSLPTAGDAASLPARATIHPSPGARFARSAQGFVDRVDLVEGALDLEVDPLAGGRRFLVATEDAEVEVRGTVFRVEAHHGELSGVSVTEGKVAVRRRDGISGGTTPSSPILLLAGEAWPSASTPGAPTLSTSGAAQAPPTAPPPVAALGPPARRASEAQAGGHAGDADARSKAAEASKERARSEASRAFAEGMSLIERGEDAAAAEKLEAFRAAHPRDPRAEDAAYLAIVSLQRAGRDSEAKAAAARFLSLYPASARVAVVKSMAGAPSTH